ncbi:MAG: hypothetical protein RL398_3517, partial [Planctomycetota bacterium]
MSESPPSEPTGREPIRRLVTPTTAGVRLDVFLAQQPEVANRSRARDLIDAGLVEVPGQKLKAGLFMEAGFEVHFRLAEAVTYDPLQPAGAPPEVRILYEDACLVAIDKPVGLAAHPPEDKRFREHTVASWAKARYGDLPYADDERRPGIVHRLDRETSGVMLLAKTAQALDFLKAQFRARTAQKEYRCIVYGEPRFQSDWIEKAIGTDPRHPDRMTTLDEGGRESSTYFEVLERFGGFAHVRCLPKTGRTHQIRVHMTAIGH